MKRLVIWVAVVLVCLGLASGFAIASEKVNINTATVEQLSELPGIGTVTAAKIIAYRTEHVFAAPEEIMEVKGIGPAKYDKIKDLIVVEAAAPKKKE